MRKNDFRMVNKDIRNGGYSYGFSKYDFDYTNNVCLCPQNGAETKKHTNQKRKED